MARRTRLDRLSLPEETDDGATEIYAVIASAKEIGALPKAGMSAYSAFSSYRTMCRFLADNEIITENDDGTYDLAALEHASATDIHGRRLFPAAPLTAWIIHECSTTDATARSVKGYLNDALRTLQGDGWATKHLRDGEPTGIHLRSLIDRLKADAPRKHSKQARPFTLADVATFVKLLDDNRMGWTELAVQAQRTWLLLCWTLFYRGGEGAYRVRWSWLDLTPGNETLTAPKGSLKTNNRLEHDVTIPHRGDCGDDGCHALCLVAQLRRWHEVCVRHEKPTGPHDLILGCVRNHAPGGGPTGVTEARLEVKFGDRTFIADPIGERLAAIPVMDHAARGVAQGVAEEQVYNEYTYRLKRLAKEARFAKRSAYEFVGTHGAKRGGIQQALAGGAHFEEVSQRACHTSMSMTLLYTDPQFEDTTTLLNGLDLQPRRVVNELPPDTPMREASCPIEHDGVACGRGRDTGRMCRIELDGEQTVVCDSHYQRYQKALKNCRAGQLAAHLASDAFTQPIRVSSIPADATCTVVHAGVACGRDRTTGRMSRIEADGERAVICNDHRNRLLDGKRGDDLTRPITDQAATPIPADATCTVVHAGVACGLRGRNTGMMHRIETDSGPKIACSAHYVRHLQGRRGDDFTRPVIDMDSSTPYPVGATCTVVHDGVACGRGRTTGRMSRIELDGGVLVVCASHYVRHRRGRTGDDFTRPINLHGRPAGTTGRSPGAIRSDATCTIAHDGTACGRGRDTGRMYRIVTDGEVIVVCSSHHRRHGYGKTGDAFTRPICDNSIPADFTCTIAHDGTACGRGRDPGQAVFRIELDGEVIVVCSSHYTRHRNGKTGDAFTRPIRDNSIPADATCTIAHDGTACGRSRDTGRMYLIKLDGEVVAVCKQHHRRHRKGRTGDALTRPFGQRTGRSPRDIPADAT